jgi:hypothetical protein
MEITNYLTKCVEENIPVSFLKFGDGEFHCAFNPIGCNCDNDLFTVKLSNSLKESFKHMVENTDNTFIGKWENQNFINMWESLVTKQVNWVGYHSILIDHNYNNNESKINLYKAIKVSKTKKIIVCNNLLLKSKYLLDADHIIFVPLNSWFDTNFDEVLNQVIAAINDDEEHIVITCCGMSAKVLLTELRKKYTKGIYLDFGSALDLICTKKNSRGWNYDYHFIENLFKELLPSNWDDAEYEYIYLNAKSSLGTHLHS